MRYGTYKTTIHIPIGDGDRHITLSKSTHSIEEMLAINKALAGSEVHIDNRFTVNIYLRVDKDTTVEDIDMQIPRK